MSQCDVMSWWWRRQCVIRLVVSPQDLVKMKRFSFLSCRWGKLLPYTCSQFGFYLSLYIQTLRMHLSFWYRPPACTLELEKCCLKKAVSVSTLWKISVHKVAHFVRDSQTHEKNSIEWMKVKYLKVDFRIRIKSLVLRWQKKLLSLTSCLLLICCWSFSL